MGNYKPYQKPRVKASDGGRSKSKRPGDVADCTVRALVAVCGGLSYDAVYDVLRANGRRWNRGWDIDGWLKKGHPGLNQALMTSGLAPLQFRWIGYPSIKGRPRVTLAEAPLAHPRGRFLIGLGCHVCAMVDGVLIDDGSGDSRHRPTRCLYGMWEVTTNWLSIYRVALLKRNPHGEMDYMQTLGCVHGKDLEEAYRVAAETFEHKVPVGKAQDLIVTPLLVPTEAAPTT